MTGEVILLGGGPGDPGLLTIAGRQALQSADVIVCDRLAPLAILDELPDVDHKEIIAVGKVPRGPFTPQQTINELLISHARAGKKVVRFKGGDSFVFGRGGEEWNACVAAGVAVSVIPGVSSAIAIPALAGIPVTHRGSAQGMIVVSGHIGPSHPDNTLDWAKLATTGLTLVILMGVAALEDIVTTLISAGMDPHTPAACIAESASTVVRCRVIELPEAASAIRPPAITVIGQVTNILDVKES